MILVVFPIAFAAGLSALLEPNSAKSPMNLEWLPVAQYPNPDCSDHFQSFPNALIFLVEHAITGEGFFECAHNSMMPVTMWIASFLYVRWRGSSSKVDRLLRPRSLRGTIHPALSLSLSDNPRDLGSGCFWVLLSASECF